MKEISVDELYMNPITLIGEQWMLVTAGTQKTGYNTMTASWGHMGCLWNLPTSVIYIRPQRYTKEFVDREEYYSLSFFPEEYRKQLGYLGSHSGRHEDKVANVGMTPVFDEHTTWFQEANLVLICRKLYQAPLRQENFLDQAVAERNYPNKDYHDLYIGEIVKVLVAE